MEESRKKDALGSLSSGTLVDRDRQYVWHPFTQAKTAPDPIPFVRAEGIWLFDADGKKYMDVNSSWWTNLHGHAHPYIADRIDQQFRTLDHTIFAGATHPAAVELAERLVGHLPRNFQKIFFSDNGSTAVEVAIKMVYQYWKNKGIKRRRFLAIEGAYHGDTFGAMSVGQRGYFNTPFEDLFFDVDYIPFPTEETIGEILGRMEDLFASGEFAGFIFEPLVQGAAGFQIYGSELLEQMVGKAFQHGVKCIADEVMTGFYRTGTMFAIDQISSEVDFVCMSKGVTGGVLACGITATTQEIFDAFVDDDVAKALLHGHSFTANPVSSAAACASLDLLEKEETIEAIQMIVDANRQFVERHQKDSRLSRIRSAGTILSMEIQLEEGSYFSPVRQKALDFFLSEGLFIRPLGNVIYINPPYCISSEQLTLVYQKVEEFLDTL